MAKATKGLTPKRIERIREPGRYHDGHGLHLQVTPAGVRSWLLRYQRDGRERWLGLGPLHTVSLKEARNRAKRARLDLLDGVDPIDARKAKKAARALAAAKALTFEEAARQYYAEHNAKWKNRKHAAQFLSTLSTYVFPTIGRLSVADIDTGLVLKCLEPIWSTKTETASRVRQRIEAVLGWATVRNYRQGDNPARWKGHLAEVLPARSQVQKIEHYPALPFVDLPEFMQALAQREGIAARALEFAILSASRTGEVIGARWTEIDLDAKVWVVPSERMKAGQEHCIPLSDQALDILHGLPREDGNPFVFIGPQNGAGLSNMAMASVLKRMHKARAASGLSPWVDKTTGELAVPHGFRSTFSDWAGDRTNFPHEVIEFVLAHGIPNKATAAYRRYRALDKRALLMQAWAKFATGPVQATGDVVSLHERAQA